MGQINHIGVVNQSKLKKQGDKRWFLAYLRDTSIK